MRLRTAIRPRFSLRWMLIAITVIALVIGYYAKAIRSNVGDIDHLRARGFDLGDRLIDPVGPNFIYNLIYRNPYVWSTKISNNEIINPFQGWLGVVGYTHVYAKGISITADDVRHLAAVPFLTNLYFIDSELPNEAAERLATVSGLMSIQLEGTSISPAALTMLREQLPNCEIDISPRESLPVSRQGF